MLKLAQPVLKPRQPVTYGLGDTIIDKIAILCANWYSIYLLPD